MDDLTRERWPGGSAWREGRGPGYKAQLVAKRPDDWDVILERRRILNAALTKVSGVLDRDLRPEASDPQDTVQA